MYKKIWFVSLIGILALVVKGRIYFGNKFIQGLEISADSASLVSASQLEWAPSQKVSLAPQFSPSVTSVPFHLSSVPDDPRDLSSVLIKRIRAILGPNGDDIKILTVDAKPADPKAKSDCETITVGLSYGGYPLCNLDLKAHQCLKNKGNLILGKVPNIEYLPNLDTTPGWDASLQIFNDWLSLQEEKQAEIHTKSICLLAYNHTLVPVWKLLFTFRSLPYEAFANESNIFQVSPQAFDFSSSGLVQAYDRNIDDGTLKTYSIPDLIGDGTLSSLRFTTQTRKYDQNADARAIQSDNQFVFSPDDPKFSEASAFAHAYSHHEFFKSLGYEWAGSSSLTIFLHGPDTNNATYLSDAGSGKPGIILGDGDGVILQNLSTDADVVAHEFGHHVIMKNLKTTTGESLVLHEGLADFFAFANQGDACLGESICPSTSGICVVPSKCLRSAQTDLAYGSTVYMAMGAHQKSQMISGLLWDLRAFMKPDDVNRAAYQTIDFLVSNSGFSDFIKGILFAENNLTQGKHCDDIILAMQKRGLSDLLTKENILCANSESYQRALGANKTGLAQSTPPPTKSSSSGCGLFGNKDIKKSSMPIHVLFFVWPAALAIISVLRKRKD